MAIAIDNSAIFSTNSNSFTVSGVDRVLVVEIFNLSGAGDPTGITYNGVALTKLGTNFLNSAVQASLWYLMAPATGSNLLVVSGAGTYDISVSSLNGSNGTVQNFASTFNSAASGADTSITSGASDMIIAGCFATNSITIAGDGGLTLDASNAHQAVGHKQSSTSSVGFSGGAGTIFMCGASVVAGSQRADYTLVMGTGSFVLTGLALGLSYGRKLLMGTGNFLLTGNNINFRLKQWVRQAKNSSLWTETSKIISSWTNNGKT